MPITYLDETPQKKITYLNEPNPVFKPKESIGQMLLNNLKGAAKETYGEVVSPIMSGASTFALGIPKAVAEEIGAKDIIYPEQKTLEGKALRLVSEGAGLVGGGAAKAAKLAVKGATKLIPKLSGQGLKRLMAKGAIAGGTFGALQTPEKGEGVLKPKERLEQSKDWAMLGGAFPLAGQTLKGAKGVITKSGRWVAKNIGGITDATVSTIKKLGANRVFDPLKAKADYISQDLTPKVYEKFNNFVKTAHDTYNKAVNSASSGKSINIRPAIEKAGNELKSLGLITNKGNLTELGKSEIARDSVYGKLLDFYQSAGAISGVEKLQGKALTQNQMIKAWGAMRETKVNKKQFLFFRDKLNALYKNKPSDIDVSAVRDAFYKAGEDAGMKGLNVAKEMENKVFDIEKKIDIRKITNDLVKAKNPQWTKVVQNEYKDLVNKGIISEKDYKDIFDDLMAHFANIDFELVSETPGAGGGIYPSRAGLIRSGVGKVAKGYYKNIQPKAQALSEKFKNLLKNTGAQL